MQIKDHVFYVTGGASGLGEATVRLLHQMGAYVTIMDLNYDAARDLSNELNSKTPPSQPRSLACKADVCSEEDVVKAIQDSDRAWPDIQVAGCVNCGGVGMAGKTIDQDGQPFDLETFRKVVDINLVGTFNVSRLTAARIVRDVPKPIAQPDVNTKDRGVIVNTASAAALEGQAGQASYAGSKGGVVGMTLPMARDLAWYGIRVMTLCPALFGTPMMENLPERAKAKILRSSEFPARFGHPQEFASAVVSIIENSMLNGSYIRLDGATRLGKL